MKHKFKGILWLALFLFTSSVFAEDFVQENEKNMKVIRPECQIMFLENGIDGVADNAGVVILFCDDNQNTVTIEAYFPSTNSSLVLIPLVWWDELAKVPIVGGHAHASVVMDYASGDIYSLTYSIKEDKCPLLILQALGRESVYAAIENTSLPCVRNLKLNECILFAKLLQERGGLYYQYVKKKVKVKKYGI